MVTGKKTYQEEMEEQLTTWRAELAQLEAEVASASDAESRTECYRQLQALEIKCNQLEQKLKELEHAGESDRESIKNELETASKEFQEALENCDRRVGSR